MKRSAVCVSPGGAPGGAAFATSKYFLRTWALCSAPHKAHARRKVIEAEQAEPALAAQALDHIGALYAIEAHIRDKKLTGENKRDYRLVHAKPRVEQFFAWIHKYFAEHDLLPSNPMTAALAYAQERRAGLEVFLTDPDVPIDTNHLHAARGMSRVLVHRLAAHAPRFLPTLGRPHAAALRFVRRDQLTGGLSPPGVRPCGAHHNGAAP